MANFINSVEFAARRSGINLPFWQTATPTERVTRWRESVAKRGTVSPNLPDSALRRDRFYFYE